MVAMWPEWAITWVQAGCPNCAAVNWASLGDSSSTGGAGEGLDAIQCHTCRTIIPLLAPDHVDEIGGVDELYAEEGLPEPEAPE
jgi:hypothetical protein